MRVLLGSKLGLDSCADIGHGRLASDRQKSYMDSCPADHCESCDQPYRILRISSCCDEFQAAAIRSQDRSGIE